MLDWAQSFAEDKGLLLYVEITKDAVAKFTDRGFETVGQVALPDKDGELVLVALLRKPKAA